MIRQVITPLAELYEADETAWLDAMADLVNQGRLEELDYAHLGEYLNDMAARDRRRVESRLTTLLAHLLKWTYQPDHRTRSWRATIVVKRQKLELDAAAGVLRNHAEVVLPNAYVKAIERAAAETGLPAETFPAACPYTVGQLLSGELPAD